MTTITKGTESLHARIPQEILAELDSIAESIGRSRNWVFNDALKHYLDVQTWQTSLIKERLTESESTGAKLITHETIMKRQEKRLKIKLAL